MIDRGNRARRWIIRSLRLAALVPIAVTASSGCAEPVDRSAMGEQIGVEAQRVICPPHEYMTGVREVLGYWLYMITPICQPLDTAGSWTGSAHLASEDLQNIGGLQAHGIWEFMVPILNCPQGTYMTGFDGSIVPVAENGKAYELPGLVRPFCRSPSNATLVRSTSDMSGWLNPRQSEIPWASVGNAVPFAFGGQSGNDACHDGEVAVGLWGSRDAWLRSVGLVCQRFEEVRPRSIGEIASQHHRSITSTAEAVAASPSGTGRRPVVSGSLVRPAPASGQRPPGTCTANPAACASIARRPPH